MAGPSKSINPISTCVVPVRVKDELGRELTKATGFFWRDAGKTYLITNWHVITARDPNNPSFSPTGSLPNSIELFCHRSLGGTQFSTVLIEKLTQSLIDQSSGLYSWQEHPKGLKVDVVAVDMTSCTNISRAHFRCLNEVSFHDYLHPAVGEDVLIVGYPLGLDGGSTALPIWQRGSIASEPLAHDEQILIDARTKSGMSGSPVIHQFAGHIELEKPDPVNKAIHQVGQFRNFMGIYSSRNIGTSELFRKAKGILEKEKLLMDFDITEIGVVWKRNVIQQILASKQRRYLNDFSAGA